MKINHFQMTSAFALDIESAITSPICVLRGRYSDLALDLMRELIGDYGAQNDPDRVDDGRFVIYADITMDNKKYDVCYIRNADFMGDHRLAVNFEANGIRFSEDDTREFADKCNERAADKSNVLMKTADVTLREDDRPIFIYDYFDRLDEAEDVTPTLDRLFASQRQVFISVCADYPIEKMRHGKVQVINLALHGDEA